MLPNGYTNKPLFVTDAMLQLSLVIGVPNETPVAVHPVLVTVNTVGGQVMAGLTLSLTVTNCAQVAVLPEPSVTVQITVVTPKG